MDSVLSIIILWGLPCVFWGSLLALVIWHIRRRKKMQNSHVPKECVRGFGCMWYCVSIVLSIALLFSMIVFGYFWYREIPETELYEDQTQDGHEFVIYEKGHFSANDLHRVVVEVDGEILFHFLYSTDSTEAREVSKDSIACVEDSQEQYHIKMGNEVDIILSSDFQTLLYIDACFNVEIEADWLEVIECHDLFYDPF